jgi:hypothetical protein
LSGERTSNNWFFRRVDEEAKKDVLSFSDRAGNILGIFANLVFLWFFITHQRSSTGFFTPRFGQTEMLLFYAPIMLDIIKTVAKAVVGRKNMIRPFDAAHLGLSFIEVVWMYMVFPFDFSHLADVLPVFLQFLLGWISNNIARILMIVAMIATSISAVYNAVLYVLVREELRS